MIFELFAIIWFVLGLIVALGVRRTLKVIDFCLLMHKGNVPCADEWRPFLKINDPPLPSRSLLYLFAFTIGPPRLVLLVVANFVILLSTFLPGDHCRVGINVGKELVLLAAGLRVLHEGKRDLDAPCLVANHGGGFDGHVIYSHDRPVTFVARAEIAKDFFLGRAAKRLSVIFVDRETDDSRNKTVDAINNYLRSWTPNQPSLLVFPEGTTSNHTHILPFKSGAFRSGMKIQPVRIEYSSKHQLFTCNNDLVGYLSTLICIPSASEVKLTWLPTITPLADESPDAMAERANRLIAGNGDVFKMGIGSYRAHRELQNFLAINGA